MRVFKATDENMKCHMGNGVFQYQLGVSAFADGSKCGTTGLHACENVVDCLCYYSLTGGNRFFTAEAEGDIAEDGKDTRIACTRLTLLKELSHREIAGEAMLFMLRHPMRENWRAKGTGYMVAEENAYTTVKDGFAIARGESPRVKGVQGAHLGLIREEQGIIVDAKLFTVDGAKVKADTWYTIENRILKEAAENEIQRDIKSTF